ncbi:hypothetical protein FQZ97_446500 [compost metagenome]
MDSWVVSRAPLVPIGSLVTCTTRLWPSCTSALMLSTALPSRVEISAAWMKAARSRPMSTKAACIPGSTRTTLPL